VGGWENVAGIGGAAAAALERAGPFDSWERLRQALPPSTYYKLHECGATGAMPIDQQATIELAQWMPVQTVDPTLAYTARSIGASSPSLLYGSPQRHDTVMVAGYVTAMQKKARTGKFKGEQIIYVVEDDMGAIEWRVPSKNTKLSSTVKATVKKGDYVAVSGWWAGDVLFASGFKLIHRRE
jgi:hypothetical protein